MENLVQIKVLFLSLEPLHLNTNIKLSNNKTKAILLRRNKRSIVRLILLLVVLLSLKYEKWENLDWTKKFLLLKIPTVPQYCERLTDISKRKRPGKLLRRYKIYNKQY